MDCRWSVCQKLIHFSSKDCPIVKENSETSKKSVQLPDQPLKVWLSPLKQFLFLQSTSGILLLICTALSLILANSPWGEAYLSYWHVPCFIGIGGWSFEKDLLHVINDGLMTIFFFVVGLEIKRELVLGELRHFRQAALPIFAALGGMLIPALMYMITGRIAGLDAAAQRGWAIPMATDIAFVVGVLALFGSRVPFSLNILLLSLAIVDDLGAVLIIAFVFTEGLVWSALGVALGGVILTWWMNRVGVRSIMLYTGVGIVVWAAVFQSGIHPTVAGVVLGLMTPATPWVSKSLLDKVLLQLRSELAREPHNSSELHDELSEAEFAARESMAPLYRLEHALHPWVALAIMPLFALANAGVMIDMASAFEPVAISVALGLVLGKPVGILLFSLIAVKVGFAELPRGVSWLMLLGGGCLAGIGFTMSLFLTALALPDSLVNAGKLGTLMGSAASLILGVVLLLVASQRQKNLSLPTASD